ncbi:MAG: RNA polymerase sigma factor [Planctomycetes bacterium]|nr:RNA polymerase sigma factor [Planctomycetota bacterium]
MRSEPLTLPPLADEAFAAQLDAARPAVLRLLRRLCGAELDAEDVLQETFAKVWRLRSGFEPGGNLQGWLSQAAFRTFCDARARQLRQPSASTPDLAAAPAPERPCDVELRDEVRHHLDLLPPLERELLLGFHVHGRSLRELAAAHALPLNTIKSHLHRARQRLGGNPS